MTEINREALQETAAAGMTTREGAARLRFNGWAMAAANGAFSAAVTLAAGREKLLVLGRTLRLTDEQTTEVVEEWQDAYYSRGLRLRPEVVDQAIIARSMNEEWHPPAPDILDAAMQMAAYNGGSTTVEAAVDIIRTAAAATWPE